MNMKLKKLLNDIQKTEDKIAELQEHLKRQKAKRCPVCGGAMKQQFIGLRHCKCGISWKISGQRVIYPVE